MRTVPVIIKVWKVPYYNLLRLLSSPGTVFMITTTLLVCLECFLYGVYSGIFAIYLQCPSKESRTATIVFYVLCLLYVLSTATVISDLLYVILETRISTLPLQLQIDSRSILFRIAIVQITIYGCCDFIAQCILIYRCWIVWGKNILVVIIPLFLAITFLATCLASGGAIIFIQGQPFTAPWGYTLSLTALVTSMAVNTLVTGLIVFKILKVFLEVERFKPEATSVERTMSSLISSGGTSLRHVVFVIIESGMALFAIQLVRIVLACLPQAGQMPVPTRYIIAVDLAIAIHQMFNGIAPTIILVRVSMRLSFDDEESFTEAVGSLLFNNPSNDPNTPAPQRLGVGSSSSSSMAPQERDGDICLDNLPSDPNTLRRVESSTSSYAASGRRKL